MRLLLQMFCISGLRIYSQKIFVNGLDISPRIRAKGDDYRATGILGKENFLDSKRSIP